MPECRMLLVTSSVTTIRRSSSTGCGITCPSGASAFRARLAVRGTTGRFVTSSIHVCPTPFPARGPSQTQLARIVAPTDGGEAPPNLGGPPGRPSEGGRWCLEWIRWVRPERVPCPRRDRGAPARAWLVGPRRCPEPHPEAVLLRRPFPA